MKEGTEGENFFEGGKEDSPTPEETTLDVKEDAVLFELFEFFCDQGHAIKLEGDEGGLVAVRGQLDLHGMPGHSEWIITPAIKGGRILVDGKPAEGQRVTLRQGKKSFFLFFEDEPLRGLRYIVNRKRFAGSGEKF
ncbi:MAG TPA: hypothetical protein VJB99_01630 [Patescibacteria group bacterium]|nr:hypothetical protein [Patescibacteria group bacterium]